MKHTKAEIMKYCFKRWQKAQGHRERELFWIHARIKLNPDIKPEKKVD